MTDGRNKASAMRVVADREYWKIYRWPAFFRFGCLFAGSPPATPPSPLSLSANISLFQSSCVSSVQLTDEIGAGERGRAWSRIKWIKESLAFYKSINPLGCMAGSTQGHVFGLLHRLPRTSYFGLNTHLIDTGGALGFLLGEPRGYSQVNMLHLLVRHKK